MGNTEEPHTYCNEQEQQRVWLVKWIQKETVAIVIFLVLQRAHREAAHLLICSVQHGRSAFLSGTVLNTEHILWMWVKHTQLQVFKLHMLLSLGHWQTCEVIWREKVSTSAPVTCTLMLFFPSHLPAWLYSAWLDTARVLHFHHHWTTCPKVCIKPMTHLFRSSIDESLLTKWFCIFSNKLV